MAINRGVSPGTFTMGNVVCGFIAILQTFEGKITTACWFVVLAAFLDALDGKVARLSGGTSQFGIELDSLADVLSFGAAPAVIIYSLKLQFLGSLGWVVICTIYLMAAVYRLARFNISADQAEKRDFLGLPVPAAALTIVSWFVFCYHVWGEMRLEQPLVAMIILLSFLMVSQVEFDALPDKFVSLQSRIKLLIIVAAGLAVLLEPRLLLFPILSLYILFGISRELVRLLSAGVGRVTGNPVEPRKPPRGRRNRDGL